MNPEQKQKLIEAAQAAGAEGVWLLRGATTAEFFYSDGKNNEQMIGLSPPHELIVIMRFEDGDGREGGVEFWTGGGKGG